MEKQPSETWNALSADYWSESDQDDIEGSLTLKQEGSSTLCDTYHRTPSVSPTPCMCQGLQKQPWALAGSSLVLGYLNTIKAAEQRNKPLMY